MFGFRSPHLTENDHDTSPYQRLTRLRLLSVVADVGSIFHNIQEYAANFLQSAAPEHQSSGKYATSNHVLQSFDFSSDTYVKNHLIKLHLQQHHVFFGLVTESP